MATNERAAFVGLSATVAHRFKDAGWLVLTHGVGPMRQYVISAILLDLKNPANVIAYLEELLLVPNEVEREGYVPNVVYSCGSLIHNGILIIPYAMSDSVSGGATVNNAILLVYTFGLVIPRFDTSGLCGLDVSNLGMTNQPPGKLRRETIGKWPPSKLRWETMNTASLPFDFTMT